MIPLHEIAMLELDLNFREQDVKPGKIEINYGQGLIIGRAE